MSFKKLTQQKGAFVDPREQCLISEKKKKTTTFKLNKKYRENFEFNL